jgi:L-2-hydroxyglutarate oxidase LhgO
MNALEGELTQAGGTVLLESPVQRAYCTSNGIRLSVGKDNLFDIDAAVVVNCAGLDAQHVAQRFEGLSSDNIPQVFYAKGNYYGVEGRVPFQHLIYPVPEEGGLGVHLTLDLSGRARFGPDVEWVDHVDYRVDPQRAESFYAAIRSYWPKLPPGALRPDYSGIRPKTRGPGSPAQDFMIQGPDIHGIRGLVNLYGIESPGLTAALAIGEYVAEKVD